MPAKDTLIPYINQRAKLIRLSIVLGVLSIMALCVCLMVGSARMPLDRFFAAVRAHFAGVDGGPDELIIFRIRLPRALMAYAVGACLSISGVCMQGIFKNPMAEPHILGVSSGAALGAAVVMILGVGAGFAGLSMISLGALIGGAGAALLVLGLSGNGRGPTINLLLSGVAVGTFLTAMLSGLLMLNHDKMESVYTWTMGSFASASMGKVQLLLPVLLIGAVIMRLFARDLNAMLMGEEQARSLGVNAGKVRLLLLCVSTLVTAVAVSQSGIIGFVGLMVPHAVRLMTGPDHRATIPISLLAGGLYLMVMDTLARTLFMPVELPVGVLTALVGGPFFLILLRRSRRQMGGEL